MVSFPLLAARKTTQLVTAFPVTGFPNWKYVAIPASFLAPVKLSERKHFVSEHPVIN